MVEDDKKTIKVTFSEEELANTIEKYDATTILTMLQEVSRYPESKIDWNELVKNTATGISNAREYQMLWRHLAYHDTLNENLEDGDDPLDDDSDMECEMEVSPSVNNETAIEASAFVKVMMASSVLSESGPSSSTIEAPMTFSLPVRSSSTTPEENAQPSKLMQASRFIFPVTVQRQTLPTLTEGVESKGTAGGKLSSKRKRKAWSEEEDMQLRAAVQKCGEGNWATMSKGDDFPIKRSPTQLAQRWSILRKKDGTTNSGTNLTSSQFTAEQLATRHSLSLALDMPLKKLTAPGTTDPARTSLNVSIKNPVQPSNTAETSTVPGCSIQPQLPSQQALLGTSASPAKSLVPERTMLKSNPSSDAAVRATAVAVGARIVSSSDILSLHKATQSAVKIVPAGNSSMKLSMSAGSAIHPKAPINVQVCTGVPATAVAVTPASCTATVKSVSPSVESTSIAPSNTPICSVANKVPIEQVNRTQELRVSNSSVPSNERVPGDEPSVVESLPGKEILEHKSVKKNLGDSDSQERVMDVDSNLNQTMNFPVDDGGECRSVIDGSSEDQGSKEKQVD